MAELAVEKINAWADGLRQAVAAAEAEAQAARAEAARARGLAEVAVAKANDALAAADRQPVN